MMIAKTKVKNVTIRAKVFRAKTGKWEDLGVVSSTNWFWRLKRFIKKGVDKIWQLF